jgi:hypothetical protein
MELARMMAGGQMGRAIALRICEVSQGVKSHVNWGRCQQKQEGW